MNLFLLFAAYISSFCLLVVVTAAALYTVALVGRKLLMSNADHASFARVAAAQRERMERVQNLLADKAAEGYMAEMDAIYYTPEAAPPLRQQAAATGEAHE